MREPPKELRPTSCAPHFPSVGESLMINGVRVTKRVRKALTETYLGEKLRKYICKRTGWTGEQFDMADWDGNFAAMEREAHEFRVWMVKMLNDWTNVGHQKQQIAESKKDADAVRHGRCPSCK